MTVKSENVVRSAFLGPENTYSNIAAEKNASFLKIDEHQLISCESMDEIIEKVQSGETDYGYAPYWNTCKHRIVTAQVGLIKAGNVRVVDNFKMDIDICLVSKARSLEEVKELHTISHIIKQFSSYESDKLKSLIFKEVGSTVKGVESILKTSDAAAVCSKRAAERYPELNILDENIQNTNNGTLFFVFKKDPDISSVSSENYTLLAYPLKKQFKTKVEVTNLLMEKLIFRTNEWSIPVDDQNWSFIEVSGYVDDIEMRELIDGLIYVAGECRIIGSYGESIEKIWDGKSRFNSI